MPLGVGVPGALVQPRVEVFTGDKVWARVLECAEERKQFIDDGKERGSDEVHLRVEPKWVVLCDQHLLLSNITGHVIKGPSHISAAFIF